MLAEKGHLAQEQIDRLDAIGMTWEDTYIHQWEYGYQQALKWYTTHHYLEVHATYIDQDGTKGHSPDPRAEGEAGRPLGMSWEKDDP